MNENVRALNKVWRNSSEIFTNKKTELSINNFEDLIGSVFCSWPFYYYVIDFSDLPARNLSYVHPSVKDFFGISIDKFTLDDVVSRVHPDDLDFVVASEKLVMSFIENKITAEDLPYYKFSYSIRVKNVQEKYVHIQHQALTISMGQDGKLGHAINVHTDISHITLTSNRTVSIFGLEGRPSFIGIDPFNPDLDNTEKAKLFSPRELEILRLAASGLKSIDVAKKLFISPDTVAKHRKNILNKSGEHSITAVVAKCIRSGWI